MTGQISVVCVNRHCTEDETHLCLRPETHLKLISALEYVTQFVRNHKYCDVTIDMNIIGEPYDAAFP